MKNADESPDITLTVERGLEVLRAFHADRAPLSNAELVRRTGLPKATVSRLTTTLIRIGFLRRAGGGRQFELGAGALGIGHAYLEVNPVTRLVNPFLQELADKLNVCVALAVAHHLDMLYIACGISTKIATLRTGVGSSIPMGSTAAGRAYLSGLPPMERRARMGAIIEGSGENAKLVQRSMEVAFDDLAESGVCVCVGEYQRNAFGIALPLRLGRSGTLMALSCGAVELQPDVAKIRRRFMPALKAAAQTLTELLDDVDCTP
ncbi:IclR family transcriptional regulator [Paraburkholderia sp. RP-4-7]|uniref:IclR family transcriptional regulator n=1 Tax=Paraburkholderia polaris TaxID=2728848 RepID=A0A848IAM2_9BURK|nr:IclR family transcriptional regulator [Paraburkholderia polaris]NML97098.1 IclR family transcriptional regulator [Paraburkholderia polaris]